MPAGPLEPTVQSVPAETPADADEAYCAACNQSFGLDHAFCPNDGARLVKLKAQADTLIGRVFDERYEIRAALGHGGMGTVYRGWQRSVDREVAIKVIHPKLAAMRQVAKRFLREARLASRLNQPNIVNVYDFGQTDDGILYLVMELLRGEPLARDLEAHRPLPVRRIAGIALQICDALDAAHGQGIIHRDLKPHNIVILDAPPGRDLLKILDFGLAKSLTQETTSLVTQTDALLGTPLYMPPEQILGKPSDQRADLYSLGCILYQMVSGRPPFIGANINVVLGAHIREQPPPLPDDVPPELAAIIQHLMSKAPEDRPATAAVVRDAFTGARPSAPPAAAPRPHLDGTRASPGPATILDAPPLRRPARWAAAGIIAVGLGTVAGFAWRSHSRGAGAGSDDPTAGSVTRSAGSAGSATSAAASDSNSGPRVERARAALINDAGLGPDLDAGIDPGIAPGVAPGVASTRDAGIALDAPRAAPPIDAAATSGALRPADTRPRAGGATSGASHPATVNPPAHRLDAGIHPAVPVDAAPPPAADAGMPDLDLLPTGPRPRSK